MTPQDIASRDNPLVKQLRALAHGNTAYREQGRVWLDGDHLVRALLARGGRPALGVFTHRGWAEADDALQGAAERNVRVPDAIMAGISALESPPRMGFVWALPAAPALQTETATVILDRLQDAGNVGSILRSAAAAGIRHAFLGTGCAFAWSPKTLRAAMGAHFNLNIVEHCTPEQLAQRLAVPVYGTSSHAQATLYDLPLQTPSAWLMGNEGSGVTEAWQPLMTQAVRIPQPGGQESLNVAAAAAVCLFEMVRQRTR